MIDPAKETAKWHASIVWTQVTATADYAEVTLAAFDKLDDYSCTIPSGTYVGKRWKRREPYHTAVPGEWWMGEYVDDLDPEQIGIVWRPIYFEYPRLRATDEIVEAVRNSAKVAAAL